MNSLDYMKALNILYPYKSQLEIIHEAYLNNEFEPELTYDIMEPYEAITYFTDSKAYEKYGVKTLSRKLYNELSVLDFLDYSFIDYINIEDKYGMQIPYTFDEKWELKDVYLYLIHLFDGKDFIIIENSLLNGEILNILNCFLIRI